MKILALLLTGLLTGNELSIGALVHPALSQLPDDEHAASVQSLARLLGRVMPFWMALALLAQFGALTKEKREASRGLRKLSAGLLAATIAFTIVGLVPINNRVSRWNLSDLPKDWKEDRRRFDTLHLIRVAMLLLSFLTLACAGSERD